MSEKIEPALSAEEWATRTFRQRTPHERTIIQPPSPVSSGNDLGVDGRFSGRGLHALIALANDALPNSDPRKITREWVAVLRKAANNLEAQYDNFEREAPLYEEFTLLNRMADAIESYLPPTPPDSRA